MTFRLKLRVVAPMPAEYRHQGVSSIKICSVVFLLGFAAALVAYGAENKADPWQPVRFLIGRWTGTAEGQAGTGTVERRYEFMLRDQFIQEHNTSTYPPQEKNKAGEVHQHMSIISYDRQRKTLVLRQFHVEGFVNLYALNQTASTPERLVFESEHFENFDNSWKAKETSDIVSPDEFIETFELAAPGKSFEIYSRNHLKRASSKPSANAGVGARVALVVRRSR
jgi:hypothetical protein